VLPDLSLRGLGVGGKGCRNCARVRGRGADEGEGARGDGEGDGGGVGGSGRRGEAEPVVQEDEDRGVVHEGHRGDRPDHGRRGHGRRRGAAPPSRHVTAGVLTVGCPSFFPGSRFHDHEASCFLRT
jgi:hypothetical protein